MILLGAAPLLEINIDTSSEALGHWFGELDPNGNDMKRPRNGKAESSILQEFHLLKVVFDMRHREVLVFGESRPNRWPDKDYLTTVGYVISKMATPHGRTSSNRT